MSKKDGKGPKDRIPLVPDPTPEEIEQRCAEVRATWDEETTLERICDPSLLPYSPAPWYPPMISVSDLPVDIFNTDEPGEFPDEFDYGTPSTVEEEIDILVETEEGFEEYIHKSVFPTKPAFTPEGSRKICDANSDRSKMQ